MPFAFPRCLLITVLLALGGACSGGTGDERGGPALLSDADPFRPDADFGTPIEPHRVELQALPFTHSDSTAESDSRQLDSYACGPAADVSGREVWYSLSIDHPVPVRINVAAEDGVDVDLYLLVRGEEDETSTCLAYGDTAIDATVPPGFNHLVVDTPVVGGEERAGAYVLTIVSAP